MKNISMIAAVGKNLELGKNNQLIWHFREDMKFFKEQTMGRPIVMGRKTLESLPKLLPGRKHIVLTSKNDIINPEIIVIHSLDALLEYINNYQDKVMVIGGASVYQAMLRYAEELILTEIDAEDKEADAYFPTFNKEEWDTYLLSNHEDHNISYKHLVYKRR